MLSYKLIFRFALLTWGHKKIPPVGFKFSLLGQPQNRFRKIIKKGKPKPQIERNKDFFMLLNTAMKVSWMRCRQCSFWLLFKTLLWEKSWVALEGALLSFWRSHKRPLSLCLSPRTLSSQSHFNLVLYIHVHFYSWKVYLNPHNVNISFHSPILRHWTNK